MHKQVEQAIRYFNNPRSSHAQVIPSAVIAQGRLLAREVVRLNKLIAKTNKQINHTCNNVIQNSCKQG